MKNLVETVKGSEGFAKEPYVDILVAKNPQQHDIPKEHLKIIEQHIEKLKLTFGYGFTFITEDEASAVLEIRVKSIIKELESREPFLNKLPLEKQEIIAEMCFQMGVGGVLKFKKMWEALKRFDYETASVQMLDSSWAKQMHTMDMTDGKDGVNRAEKLAKRMRGV